MQGKKLGFTGVGQLAQPMVKYLFEQGYDVLVHNRRPDPLERLISKGAMYCPRPEDAVENKRPFYITGGDRYRGALEGSPI